VANNKFAYTEEAVTMVGASVALDFSRNVCVTSMNATSITSVTVSEAPLNKSIVYFRVISYSSGRSITGFPSSWKFEASGSSAPFSVGSFEQIFFTIFYSDGVYSVLNVTNASPLS
jgi:hypothetical protein